VARLLGAGSDAVYLRSTLQLQLKMVVRLLSGQTSDSVTYMFQLSECLAVALIENILMAFDHWTTILELKLQNRQSCHGGPATPP
jgi:hypothetical protein